MKTLIIGRSSHCDIVINDASMEHTISRVHAEIGYADGQYIFRNLGKNGSTLHGISIGDSPVYVSPGAPILLANRIPLPWVQIYAILPSTSSSTETRSKSYVGLCFLCFFIPLVGFILYFTEKRAYPMKSSLCLKWAGIGFAFNILLGLVYSF